MQDVSRIEPLLALAKSATEAEDGAESVVEELVQLLEQGVGSGRQRMMMGDALAALRDPRLHNPVDDAYWAKVVFDDGPTLKVGKHPVTTQEFRSWINEGGYNTDAHWSSEGLAWRNSKAPTWAELADDPDLADLVHSNQPVVGVTFFEAEAYAKAQKARLLHSSERRWVVRGAERRPYPWGQPFGGDNANTREEGLGRPVAVGVFVRDCTPDGVTDLAGNVAEWLEDEVGAEERIYHPGSWKQPSMASWAKAIQMAEPFRRASDLGFRLAKQA